MTIQHPSDNDDGPELTLTCGLGGDPCWSAAVPLWCMQGRTIGDLFQTRQYGPDGCPVVPGSEPMYIQINGRLLPATDLLAEYWLFLFAASLVERPALLETARQYHAFRDGHTGTIYWPNTPYPGSNGHVCTAAAIAAWCGGRALQPPFDELITRIEGPIRPDGMLHPVYTLGYRGLEPTDVVDIMAGLDAVLVDIRDTPYSKRPCWNIERLRILVGMDRYLHLQALGNPNHRRRGAPIVLRAPRQALPRMQEVLTTRPALLLCACEVPERCHRSLAGAYLSAMLNVSVTHLQRQPTAGTQARLPLV